MADPARPRRPLAAALGMLVLLGVTGLIPHAPAPRAAMLDAQECTKLKAEEAELAKAGVRGHLTKGPAWAKANLGLDGVERVRRLIAVDEQIAFRCPRPPPPKPAVAEGAPPPAKGKTNVKAAKADAKQEAKAAETGAEAKAKPRPKPKPKPAAGEETAKPAKAAAPAPKVARPKADDAYSPTGAPPKKPETTKQ